MKLVSGTLSYTDLVSGDLALRQEPRHRVLVSGTLPFKTSQENRITRTEDIGALSRRDLITGAMPRGPRHRVLVTITWLQTLPRDLVIETLSHRDLGTGATPLGQETEGSSHRVRLTGTLSHRPCRTDLVAEFLSGTVSQGPCRSTLPRFLAQRHRVPSRSAKRLWTALKSQNHISKEPRKVGLDRAIEAPLWRARRGRLGALLATAESDAVVLLAAGVFDGTVSSSGCGDTLLGVAAAAYVPRPPPKGPIPPKGPGFTPDPIFAGFSAARRWNRRCAAACEAPRLGRRGMDGAFEKGFGCHPQHFIEPFGHWERARRHGLVGKGPYEV
ncbi:hypothetical protein M885DRAFT_184082 [Pelagophyceae sp. CCMP2097]|nr:hypothetical protein M885DRAFT_184082 [Pelagophyceae sp. CCMP2097]